MLFTLREPALPDAPQIAELHVATLAVGVLPAAPGRVF